ncbi:reverse transcriptase [Tanacetum coccineum]
MTGCLTWENFGNSNLVHGNIEVQNRGFIGKETPEQTKIITKSPCEPEIIGQEGSHNDTRIITSPKCGANKEPNDVYVGTNRLKVWKRRPRPGVGESLDTSNTNEGHRGKRVYEDFIDEGNMDVDIVKKPRESLGNPWTVGHLHTLVKDSSPSIMFLMESRMHDSEVAGLKFSFPQYNLLVVNPVGRAGGLLLFWKKECDLSVASFSKNHIDFVVKEDSGIAWRCEGWICFGDFNEILYAFEKYEMISFLYACNMCNLEDMDATSVKFTWSNSRQGCDNVKKRLDRFLANADWFRLYPDALFQNLAWISSDHSPTICHLSPRVHKTEKMFRFESMWLRDESFHDVRDAWTSGLARGRKSDTSTKSGTVALGGDKNTRFFHTRATSRNKRNSILRLKDEDGRWVENADDVCDLVSVYFSNLFSSSSPQDCDSMVESIDQRLTGDDILSLKKHVTTEEVYDAQMQMAPTKAPGPDGMFALFFQKFWGFVGITVMNMVSSFFESGVLPPNINKTIITLIPKVSRLESLKDMGPISLCNVLYKIISKVLVNRIKPILPRIVHENQSTFISTRVIIDNAIVAFEVMHWLKNRKDGKREALALKIDMSKAYDRVEWHFIRAVLGKFGFPTRFTNLIMACVSSVSYSFNINGQVAGHVTPARGLRQGDPISPYLFIMCAEVLSSMIRKSVTQGHIHGVKVCRGAPAISHLFFADDSIFFLRASSADVINLKNILVRYCRSYGQIINYEKSEVSFSANVEPHVRTHIIESLEVREVTVQSKYLVAQAMPMYVMNIFLLPDTLIDDIHIALNCFWWGDGIKANPIRWCSWDKMCFSKFQGGDSHHVNVWEDYWLEHHRRLGPKPDNYQVTYVRGLLNEEGDDWNQTKKIHGQVDENDANVDVMSKLLLMDYHKANQQQLTTTRTKAIVKWTKPNGDYIKFNCDASWQKEYGRAGLGFVARNARGDMLLSGAMAECYASSPLEAEAKSLLWTINQAHNKVAVEISREPDSVDRNYKRVSHSPVIQPYTISAEGDLRKFSDIGAWVQVPRCMAWLDYDEHVDSLSTMDNEVGVTSPESTTQTLPSFEKYTPPVTYPEELEKTLGTPIEVEPLNETKLEEVGLNCDHNTPLSSREVPSFNGPEPQPLLNSPSLDVSIGDVMGLEPPIKPDSSRMKVVDYVTTQTPPSPHVEMFDDDWGLESKEVYLLGEKLSLFDRINEVERGRILEAHRLELILQQQISQRMASSHHDVVFVFDYRLYLMRRSLEVLRKFHCMILGGRFNQLSHVSSPLLSKPGEY